MSIAITGPARYRYQDKVILEQILRFWCYEISCFYEPKNGEDATIRLRSGVDIIETEIQVKGAESPKAALDIKQLTEYLAHFPEYSDECSLVERLCLDSNKRVLLVCAQRATDECVSLIKLRQWAGEIHDKSAALNSLSIKLLDQFKSFKEGIATTGVDARRKLATRELPAKIKAQDLRQALRRLIVLDQWDESYVDECIRRHLTQEHRIPGDVIEDVKNRLLTALRSLAGSGNDVIPQIIKILEEASSVTIRPLDYVPRDEEQVWRESLANERVLLLSGPPRCGKTEAACWIAADYEKIGFSVAVCYSVEDAERLIRDPSRAQIVVVLDDPLGAGTDNTAKAFRAYPALRRLFERVPTNRRLIVAQSQEPLLASAGVTTLGQVVTASSRWNDLSIYPATFLERVWRASTLKYKVSQHVINLVESGLVTGDIVAGPGTLNHLAANAGRLPLNSTLADVHALAAQSANDFSISLCATPVSKKIVRALAIGSSEREALAQAELAFMLGSGGEPKLPAFPGMIYGFGSTQEDEPRLPIYDDIPRLLDNEIDEVANLQQHSVIGENRLVGFRFTHPFYRAAARAAVVRATSIERDALLALITRGLLSLSPDCSAAAARNLNWLYHDLDLAVGLGEEIVKAAEQALSWYFPKTRDLCYEFLITLLERDPIRYSARVGQWIAAVLSYGIDDIQWGASVPFIPEGMEQSWMFLRDFEGSKIKDISAPLNALRDGETLPRGQQVVEVIKYFEEHPEELDENVLGRLLSINEGILRAPAAAIWASVEHENDMEMLRRIFCDTHPKVVADTVKSILKAWSHFSDGRKTVLVEMIESWCQRPETAAAVLKELFAYFYKGEDWHEEQEVIPRKSWEIFAELFPRAIQRFPISFWLSDARVYSVCQDALQNLPSRSAFEVAYAWANMIDRKIREGLLPSDFELGVVSSALQSPVIDHEQRYKILKFAISIPSTGAMLVFMADAADEWENLSSNERALVTNRLTSVFLDSVWSQAAVLTRSVVPVELERLILGPQISLSMSPQDLVESLNPPLLEACIKLYRGEPQPLWYLAKHHSKSHVWRSVIQYLGSVPEHILFDDCIAELIAFDEEALLNVVQRLDAKSRERVFNQLIECKVGVVGEWHQRVVDSLLQLAPDGTAIERMQAKMTSRAIAVFDSVSDIFAWTTHPTVRRSLLLKVEGDAVARRNLNSVWKIFSTDKERAKNAFLGILGVAKSKTPVLHGTYSEILDLGRKVGAPTDLLEIVEKARLGALELHHQEKEAMRPSARRLKLPNWCGPGQ